MHEKILIGTASFGQKYGIANTQCINQAEVRQVLEMSRNLGLAGVDTAPAYGDSEKILGSAGLNGLKTYSKVEKALDLTNLRELRSSVQRSCLRLGVETLHGICVHSHEQFLSGGRVGVSNLLHLTEEGLIKTWGVSAYTLNEVEQVLRISESIDYLQVPVSVANQEFISKRASILLDGVRADLHARSVFLQGALLMSPDKLPETLAPMREMLEVFRNAASHIGLSVYQAALNFVTNQERLALVIVGVNSPSQVATLSNSLASISKRRIEILENSLKGFDSEHADPRKWSF